MEKRISSKDVRINFRLSPHHKQVIERAAELRRTTVSDFVLATAYEAAHRIIDQQTQIRMPKSQWEDFCRALDAPPKRVPALHKLLTKPGIFDDPA